MSFNPGGGGSSTLAGDSDVALSNLANNQVLTYKSGIGKWQNVTPTGGGASEPVAASAYVYQSGGSTTAIARDGTTISSLATTAANNVTVINAAITAVSGTHVDGGYGGGGVVVLSDDVYTLNNSIVVKAGVSLRGCSNTFDRGNSTAQYSTYGTSIQAAANSIKLIKLGVQTTAGNHLNTNPHGATISNLTVDGQSFTGVTGVYLIDTSDVKLFQIQAVNCSIGFDIDSTQAANVGTFATKIIQCDTRDCDTGINIDPQGSGSTDGEITSCRILASNTIGVNLQAGGWVIAQCHMTSGSQHIDIGGSGTTITNNYFDVAGNNTKLNVGTGKVTIHGNWFVSSSSSADSEISIGGNGYHCVISSNVVMLATGGNAFVQLPSGTVSTMDTIVMGNSVDIHQATNFTSIVINNTGGAVADQDTTGGPYIKGNRTWVGQ